MVGNLLGDPMQDVPFDAEVEAVFEDHPEQKFKLVQWRRDLTGVCDECLQSNLG